MSDDLKTGGPLPLAQDRGGSQPRLSREDDASIVKTATTLHSRRMKPIG
ncbi:hypothetical protein [Longimicrobium terrae]|uniref:Uncharacterized protein n=1 Tax=Longimicrobium terrae TaxID=1639882 RepID=A0A841GLC3_9BACT|nr:hypothetical protein [Longimicrobium terrae]MBB4635157.1 hypothetical protein [Longimicrobium terrae]MBB6069551.1 hypothetical protein [Longimicrobium terrae]NNC31646.1 hypothetical protein [Longimicrobium terrae]